MARKKKPSSETCNNPFPARLADLMDEKKITQDQLGKAIGKGRASISQYVTGQSDPPFSALVDIAKYFHVSTDYLLGLTFSRSADITNRAICERTNLSDRTVDALAALTVKGPGDGTKCTREQIAFFLDKLIFSLCSDRLPLLDDIARYCVSVYEILYALGVNDSGDRLHFGGALPRPIEDDYFEMLRFKISRGLDSVLDDIAKADIARSAQDIFRSSYDEIFWRDDSGQIAGPIWYDDDNGNRICMTFSEYSQYVKRGLSMVLVPEKEFYSIIRDVWTEIAEEAAAKLPAGQTRLDIHLQDITEADYQKALEKVMQQRAERKWAGNGVLPEENE